MPMSANGLRFSVDTEKLRKLRPNFLNFKEGMDACSTGQFKGEERLFLSILETQLLNNTIYSPQKKLVEAGEKFEEAYFIVSGEVLITRNELTYKLGAGAVLGLSEGMVGLPSRYSAVTLTSTQAKIIPFHKVDSIINFLPAELRAILVTIIKRNLAA